MRLTVVVPVDNPSLLLASTFIARAAQTVPPLLPLVLFVALDVPSHVFLLKHNVSATLQPRFISVFEIMHSIVSLGYDVFYMHVSSIPLRNPLNHLIELPLCDYTCALDESQRLSIYKGILTKDPSEKKMDRGNIPKYLWQQEANRLGDESMPIKCNIRGLLLADKKEYFIPLSPY